MTFTPLWIALLVAALDWLAVANAWDKARYLTKPGVILILILWLGMSAGFGFPIYLFLLGLVFSMAGDIFLLRQGSWFLLGLVAFLIGYFSYTLGFNYRSFPINLATPFVIVLVSLPAAQLYRRIAAGLSESGNGRLKIPVLIFSINISLMVVSALLTLVQPEWRWLTIPSWLVTSGAILLFISDSLLALNRFVSPVKHGDLLVIVAYHLGQILITSGVIFNFTVLSSQ